MKKIILTAFLLSALLACSSKPTEEIIEHRIVFGCGKGLDRYLFYAQGDSDEIYLVRFVYTTPLENLGITEKEFEEYKEASIQQASDTFGDDITYYMELIDDKVVETIIVALAEASEKTLYLLGLDPEKDIYDYCSS